MRTCPVAGRASTSPSGSIACSQAGGARRRRGRSVLDGAATTFGTAAANLVNLFNPERIVVGRLGGAHARAALAPAIREVIADQALGLRR